MTDAAAIARGLTKAERKAVKQGKWGSAGVCNALISLGLVEHEERNWVVPTTLGRAIRAELEKEI